MRATISRYKVAQRVGRFAWSWAYRVEASAEAVAAAGAPWGRRHTGEPVEYTEATTLDEARRLARRIPGKPLENWKGGL